MASRIGIIGIGLLGSALAERLLRADFEVVGFDLDPARMSEFADGGGQPCDNARQVAASSDRVLLSLPDSPAVEAVVGEIEDELRAGMVIIDTTTGAPDAVTAVAGRLAARQVHYLDATVAGSSQQARSGDIVIMASGDRDCFDDCQEIFAALARHVFHVGPSGSGSRMKLIVNLVLGLNRAVLAEGLTLASACGLDLPATLEVLRSGAAYSAVMDTKGQKMIEQDFAAQARLAQHLKDVGLILDLGRQANASLPLSTIHQQLLRTACELGYAEADNSAVIKALGVKASD